MSFSREFVDSKATRVGEMSLRLYILLLSFFIAGGIAVSAVAVKVTYDMPATWLLLLGSLAVSFLGIFISKSDNWVVSLVGYFLVVSAMGAMMGPYVASFTLASVAKVFILTMVVTIAIGTIGALYPNSVESWGGFLLTGLLVLIVAQFSVLLLPLFGFPPDGAMRALDWVGVFLFSGYVFYDMNQAVQKEDYTLDSAVDGALSMYLNVANLFVRFLGIAGDRDD